jgi:hypothetical protein
MSPQSPQSPIGARHRLHRARAALALASAALLAAAPLPSLALDAAGYASAYAEFQRAGSDHDAIAGTAQRWQALSAAEPADPVLRAYAGAATAMLARTTVLPWRKLSHAEDGLAQIDKALAQLSPAHDAPAYRGVPASLEVRFTAASTFLALPPMFHRGERGAALLAEVTGSPLFDAAPLPFRAGVWLRAAQAAAQAERKDEARAWLQKVVASGAPQAAAAQAQLKAL